MTTSLINVAIATSAELLAFFNANTGGAQIKKFADRKTAERRVNALIAEMEAEEPGYGDKQEEDERSTSALEAGANGTSADDFAKVTEEQHAEHRDEAPVEAAPKTSKRGGPQPEISASMKLDRRTICLETNEVWSNAGKIWSIHGTAWMTISQHDKLTLALYTGAKKGSPVSVPVTCADGVSRTFKLVGY